MADDFRSEVDDQVGVIASCKLLLSDEIELEGDVDDTYSPVLCSNSCVSASIAAFWSSAYLIAFSCSFTFYKVAEIADSYS